jgi:hypothetical protein
MNRQLLKDTLGWGILLWLIGYILGIIFYMIMPSSMIGYVIMPIGIGITLWVLFTRIKANSFGYYLWLAVFWTAIAIVFDFLFLVRVFKPADGYYKLDVYLYYILTFILPVIIGWNKKSKKEIL